VHLAERAVAPPGEARSDLEIFLDYARRMDFRDRDGAPLIKWKTPEEAFEAWKACSRGRPCDYGDLSYERLRGTSGIQWGPERLYTDGVFNTDPDYAESFGHDLVTGAAHTEDEYRAKEPHSRAFLHAVDYQPSPEVPGDERPLLLTTGRTLYHFHTRTKTGRVPELNAAAPEVWAEMCEADAERLGLAEGQRVRLESARGAIEAPLRLTPIHPGVVFVPFHYGGTSSAANELTITAWDPVSKQPIFKVAAVKAGRA
jgi:anaerobic selenocysteine-containing dehydrogenase